MNILGRRDWNNLDTDPDEGNYWEYLNVFKRFKMGTWTDFVNNLKRAVKHKNLHEFRWIRNRYYKKHREEMETVRMSRIEAVELIDLITDAKNFLHGVELGFSQATPEAAGNLRYRIEHWINKP